MSVCWLQGKVPRSSLVEPFALQWKGQEPLALPLSVERLAGRSPRAGNIQGLEAQATAVNQGSAFQHIKGPNPKIL